MEKMARELEELGAEVVIEETPLPKPAVKMYDFDIVHVWHLSMPWSHLGIWAAKSKGLTTFCTALYEDTEEFVPYEMQQVLADEVDALIAEEGEKMPKLKVKPYHIKNAKQLLNLYERKNKLQKNSKQGKQSKQKAVNG